MNRTILKWLLFFLCLGGFLLIALNLSNLAPVDGAVYGAVSSMICPPLTVFFKFISGLITPIPLLLITFVVLFFMTRREYRIPLLGNLCISVLLNLGLKNVFTRPRPVEVVHLAVETGYSFPSGHTMAAACFFGFLIWLLLSGTGRRWLRITASCLFALLVLLIALSRVYLGVHYFSDVFAGLLISACYLIVYISLVKLFFSSDTEKLHRLQESSRWQLLRSFSYAIEGIVGGFKNERNMVIHFGFTAIVVVFGALLGISEAEWLTCLVLFGLVFMAELMNTAVETVVDMVSPERDPRAKLAKDTAAGAVLCAAIAAAIAGAIIFLPKIWNLLQTGL